MPRQEKLQQNFFFNRKINCHLDFIHPDYKPNKNTEQKSNCSKIFLPGDRVSARNYVGKTMWLLGEVKSRTGALHYEVTLDNGKVIRRHVDQMRKIGDQTPAVDFENLHYYPPPPIVPGDDHPRGNNNNVQNTNVSQENKEKRATPRIATPRPKRNTKPPVRLNYDKFV